MANNEESKKRLSRRQALKLLTAVTGATALSNLPSKWSKPLLQVGVLPAHAQISPTPTATSTAIPTPTNTPTPLQGSLNVGLDWSAEVGQMDLDLEVFDPGDGMWATPNNLSTYTLMHGGGAPLGGLGMETVASTIGVVAGDYAVRLQVIDTDSSQGFLLFANIMISANGGPAETRFIQFTDPPPANGTLIQIADVNFPSGNITWYIP